MTSQLGATAKATRIVFFGSIAAVFLYIIGSQIFFFSMAYLASIRPKPVIPATVGFGKLSKPNFRSVKLAGTYPQIELDNTTGELPSMPNKIEVYAMVEPKSTYLSLDRAKDLSKRLEFTVAPQTISSSIYFWEENNRTLKMNVYTQNFVLDTDLSKLVIPVGELPQESEIKSLVKTILTGKGLLDNGYAEGDTTIILATVDNGEIVRTKTPSDSSLALVNFYRTLKDPQDKTDKEYPPLLPPDPQLGNIQTMVYTSGNGVEPLRIVYNDWEIDKKTAETYPLKNVSAAWQELAGGTAIISSVVNKASTSLTPETDISLDKVYIRNIYLAYFDDEDLQKYLQPIYVFEGEGKDSQGESYSFTAYDHAVDTAWVE